MTDFPVVVFHNPACGELSPLIPTKSRDERKRSEVSISPRINKP